MFDDYAKKEVRYGGYRTRSRTLWNEAAALVVAGHGEGWRWLKACSNGVRGIAYFRSEILASRENAAAWIMACLESDERDVWVGLRDHDPGFLQAIWATAFGQAYSDSESVPLFFWVEDVPHSGLRVVTPEDWMTTEDEKKVFELLGEPDPQWILQVGR
ncbi:MAG: hypothetical protein ISS74_01325 [Planctomycetes bacterium]|nr:hypothetical protein [Planctomycetota bacterium]